MRKIESRRGWYDSKARTVFLYKERTQLVTTGCLDVVAVPAKDWRKLMAVRKAAHEVTRLDPKSSPLRATVDALELRNG